jgi:hypothetical protein
VTEGQLTKGTDNNADVQSGGENQVIASTDVRFAVGPRLATVTASDANWRSVGDVLTIAWNEAAAFDRGDGAELTEEEVEAILDLAVAYQAGTVVRLQGSGTTTWTLTIETADMTDGVSTGEVAKGRNNGDVTDGDGAPQVPVAGVTVTEA